MAKPLEVLGLDNLAPGMDAKSEALAKLNALAENVDMALNLRKSSGLLQRAVKSWHKGRIARAAQFALEAANVCETNAMAYLVLAMALEKMGHLYKALVTYEKAYQLDPDDPEILINLGQLAGKFNKKDTAEELYRRYIDKRPDSPLGYNNFACLLSETNRVEDAIEILRQAIFRLPQESLLWNSLATTLAEEGRVEESLIFYREAIRLSPGCTRYYHNLGYALMHLERIDEAIALYEEALEHVVDVSERYESLYSRSICLLQVGRLEEGFAGYEIRNNKRFRGYTHFMLKAPEWQGEPLAGKRLLAVGEQGLGDEIMFANVLPDLARTVGEAGELQIAVEPRLVPLFRRSFPGALVGPYDDRALLDKDGNKELRFFPFLPEDRAPDYYATMGTFLQHYRKRIEDFPRKAFLKPDPERTRDFRARLSAGGEGPIVGICWRSMMLSQKRAKYYSSLDMWGPIFKTPGVRFVNLQYGDCEKELAEAESLHGIRIERIPDHDLTKDIDGNAALSAATDLVISAPTSVAAVSSAVGVETWFLLSNNGWPQLGTEEYPWYRKTRTFAPKHFADWNDVILRAAEALRDFSAAY
jgi:tetratricopeptide (TPR) repeat protein